MSQKKKKGGQAAGGDGEIGTLVRDNVYTYLVEQKSPSAFSLCSLDLVFIPYLKREYDEQVLAQLFLPSLVPVPVIYE